MGVDATPSATPKGVYGVGCVHIMKQPDPSESLLFCGIWLFEGLALNFLWSLGDSNP